MIESRYKLGVNLWGRTVKAYIDEQISSVAFRDIPASWSSGLLKRVDDEHQMWSQAIAELTSSFNSALSQAIDALPDPVDVLAVLSAATTVKVAAVGAKVGFYGTQPVPQQQKLTAPVSGSPDVVSVLGVAVLGGSTATTVNNHTVRINEIEARLKAYGLLP